MVAAVIRVQLTLVVEVADIADGRPAPLDRAGFTEVRWHPPSLSPEALSPEALKDYGKQYWSTFLEFPPVTFIECIR